MGRHQLFEGQQPDLLPLLPVRDIFIFFASSSLTESKYGLSSKLPLDQDDVAHLAG